MKYIEVIVLINILIHISFIRLSNFIMRRKNKILPIIISVLLDGVYVTLYLLIPEKIESFKYIFILVLSILPFISKNLSTSLFNTLIYLMLNFILGGLSEIIINIIKFPWVILICLIGINLLFVLYDLYKRINIKDYSTLFDIMIIYNKEVLYLKGFCDTGNLLITNENIPVIFINNKYKIGSYYKDIIVKTVTGSKNISLYKIDSLAIKIKGKYVKKDVYISFSEIKWDVLFGLTLLGG